MIMKVEHEMNLLLMLCRRRAIYLKTLGKNTLHFSHDTEDDSVAKRP